MWNTVYKCLRVLKRISITKERVIIFDLQAYIKDFRNYKKVYSKKCEQWVYITDVETTFTGIYGNTRRTTKTNNVIVSGVLSICDIISLHDLLANYTCINGNRLSKSSIKLNTWFKTVKSTKKPVWACFVPTKYTDKTGLINRSNLPHGKGDFIVFDDYRGKPKRGTASVVNGIVFAYEYNNRGLSSVLETPPALGKPEITICRDTPLRKPESTTCNAVSLWDTNPSMPYETKRVWYDILKERIDTFLDDKKHEQDTLISLKGIRRIGKTILLQQLCNTYDTAIYIDCTHCTKLDFKEEIAKKKEEGYNIFLIDEVCKLSDFSLSRLISMIKVDKSSFYILTGSVPFVVEHIHYGICDGELIAIPPIMYIERIAWNNNGKSDMIQLKNYLLKSSLVKQAKRVVYLKGLVEDTLNSYNAEKYDVYRKKIQNLFESIEDSKLIKLLHYVVECQLAFRGNPDKSEYNKPTSLIENRVLPDNFKAEDIKLFCEMLERSGLVSSVINYNDKKDDTAYLFEHPQYLQAYNTTEPEVLLDLWLEDLILSRLNYIFEDVGKYKTVNGDKEIDGVYSVANKLGVVETKNRKANSVRHLVPKYEKIVEIFDKPISERVITCNDVEFEKVKNTYMIRNDTLICILEKAYVEKVQNSNKIDLPTEQLSLVGLIDNYLKEAKQ